MGQWWSAVLSLQLFDWLWVISIISDVASSLKLSLFQAKSFAFTVDAMGFLISTWITFSATPVLGRERLGRSPVRRFISELLPDLGGPTNTHCIIVWSSFPFSFTASSNAATC